MRKHVKILGVYLDTAMTLTLTLTLKIVYLDTTDILQLNYYIQHIGNKKLCRLCQGDHIKTYGCRYHMTT